MLLPGIASVGTCKSCYHRRGGISSWKLMSFLVKCGRSNRKNCLFFCFSGTEMRREIALSRNTVTRKATRGSIYPRSSSQRWKPERVGVLLASCRAARLCDFTVASSPLRLRGGAATISVLLSKVCGEVVSESWSWTHAGARSCARLTGLESYSCTLLRDSGKGHLLR